MAALLAAVFFVTQVVLPGVTFELVHHHEEAHHGHEHGGHGSHHHHDHSHHHNHHGEEPEVPIDEEQNEGNESEPCPHCHSIILTALAVVLPEVGCSKFFALGGKNQFELERVDCPEGPYFELIKPPQLG